MRRLGKLAVVAIATTASFGLARSVQADSVKYGTFGTFTAAAGSGDATLNLSTDGSTSKLTGTTASTPPGSIVLAFKGMAAGTPADSSPDPGTAITLGVFTLSGFPTATFDHGLALDTFAVTVDQTKPSSGTNSGSYSISGTISQSLASGVVFTPSKTLPPDFFIGGEEYELTNKVTLNADDNFTIALTGTLVGPADASTPLPSSALGGMGLFGLLIGRKVLRRVPSIA